LARHALAVDTSREDCSSLTCLIPEAWAAQLRTSPAYDIARAARLLDGLLYGVDIGFSALQQFRRNREAANAASTKPAHIAALIDGMIAEEVALGFKRGPSTLRHSHPSGCLRSVLCPSQVALRSASFTISPIRLVGTA
jgi:hypothetical protein